MSQSWKARDGEIAKLKSRAGSKVDSWMSTQAATRMQELAVGRQERRVSSEGRILEHSRQHQAQIHTVPSVMVGKVHTPPDVEGRRSDQRQLAQEIMEQRAQEWARQSAKLRQIRQQSVSKLKTTHDDQFLIAALQARPLHALTASPALSARSLGGALGESPATPTRSLRASPSASARLQTMRSAERSSRGGASSARGLGSGSSLHYL